MAAKRKKTKSKSKRISLKSRTSKRKKTKQRLRLVTSLISSFKISFMVCILGGTAVGLLYLDKYRKEAIPPIEGEVKLELVEIPA